MEETASLKADGPPCEYGCCDGILHGLVGCFAGRITGLDTEGDADIDAICLRPYNHDGEHRWLLIDSFDRALSPEELRRLG